MALKVKSRTPSRPARASRAKAEQGMLTMLMVTGDPAVALKGVVLPAGAEVAIVASTPEAVKKIKRSGEKRFGIVRNVYARVTRPETAKAVVINRDAFEPDARSRALLEGVRIVQEDLRAAGAHTTWNRSGRCCAASPGKPSTNGCKRGACWRFPARAIDAASRHCNSTATARSSKA